MALNAEYFSALRFFDWSQVPLNSLDYKRSLQFYKVDYAQKDKNIRTMRGESLIAVIFFVHIIKR